MPDKLTIINSPGMDIPEGSKVTIASAGKKDMVLNALGGGISSAINNGVGLGFLNVLWQETDPKLKGFKRLISQREKFEFEGKSFSKWTAIGLGVGFAVGATTSAIGAIHHNREVDKWAERENSSILDTGGVRQGK